MLWYSLLRNPYMFSTGVQISYQLNKQDNSCHTLNFMSAVIDFFFVSVVESLWNFLTIPGIMELTDCYHVTLT